MAKLARLNRADLLRQIALGLSTDVVGIRPGWSWQKEPLNFVAPKLGDGLDLSADTDAEYSPNIGPREQRTRSDFKTVIVSHRISENPDLIRLTEDDELTPLKPEENRAALSAPVVGYEDLVAWPRLIGLLDQLLNGDKVRRGIDEKQLIRWIAKAKPLLRLPLKSSRAWSERLTVVLDFSSATTPVHMDMHNLCERLCKWYEQNSLSLRVLIDSLPLDGKPTQFCDWKALNTPRFNSTKKHRNWLSPQNETVLLVGDLGAFSPSKELAWLNLAIQLRANNCTVMALVNRPGN